MKHKKQPVHTEFVDDSIYYTVSMLVDKPQQIIEQVKTKIELTADHDVVIKKIGYKPLHLCDFYFNYLIATGHILRGEKILDELD